MRIGADGRRWLLPVTIEMESLNGTLADGRGRGAPEPKINNPSPADCGTPGQSVELTWLTLTAMKLVVDNV